MVLPEIWIELESRSLIKVNIGFFQFYLTESANRQLYHDYSSTSLCFLNGHFFQMFHFGRVSALFKNLLIRFFPSSRLIISRRFTPHRHYIKIQRRSNSTFLDIHWQGRVFWQIVYMFKVIIPFKLTIRSSKHSKYIFANTY